MRQNARGFGKKYRGIPVGIPRNLLTPRAKRGIIVADGWLPLPWRSFRSFCVTKRTSPSSNYSDVLFRYLRLLEIIVIIITQTVIVSKMIPKIRSNKIYVSVTQHHHLSVERPVIYLLMLIIAHPVSFCNSMRKKSAVEAKNFPAIFLFSLLTNRAACAILYYGIML